MKFSPEQKGFILAVTSSFAALAIAFAGSGFFRPARVPSLAANNPLTIPREGTPARHGYNLFLQNCAHCHGDDARGDEGPDLHSVKKSNKRIAAIIKNGIKGEMPKFNAKFTDADVRALIAFVRSLN